MDPLLLSFLSKLPNQLINAQFQLSGPVVEGKYKELDLRFNLSQDKLIGLAILLQQLDLTLFSDAELLALAELPLHYLEVLEPANSPPLFKHRSTPLYDTGSAQLVLKLASQGVGKRALYESLADLNLTSYSLRELILLMYTGGR